MKNKIKALLVDDEGLDRELIKNLVRDYCNAISIVGEASSVAEALTLIEAKKPELIFLDINMPNQNGFGLLETVKEKNFLTVLTTGYDSYGIQAVKAGAFDYLLKPIDVDELLEVESKVLSHLRKEKNVIESVLKVFHNGEHHFVKPEEIILVKAQGSYTKLYLTGDRELVVSKNLKQLLSEISSKNLQRVHRSCIINLNFIRSYQHTGNEGTVTMANGDEISVSRSYKHLLKNLAS
jgi:two-component system, LytTR family, response regulator